MLGELLGRGGMAEVFSGTVIGSHGFQKPVAIKRLLPELANDDVFVERLIGEAKLLVGMQHGNIVSVLDLARDGDDVFLVMEYVDGPSLRQLLKARGKRRLSLGVASYIVQSAAAGLEFAHARPGGAIIHADISPSNLLLTTSGEVRVADFGIARREGGGAGIVEGKWAYMAPEQARGEPLTPRSDVFALGVVLYELITGRHPLGQQISAEERDSGPIRVVPPRVVNPAVPPGLDAICMRALAENARDRYARMQHLIDALMDERFTNQWRDGANDLAQAIREISSKSTLGAALDQPRTQVTDRPVTIVTSSLISQSQRTPRPEVADPTGMIVTAQARGSAAIIPPSGAQTQVVDLPLPPPSAAAPPLAAAMLPGPELARLSAAMLPAPELASVHGGATITGSALIDLRETRDHRWTFAVLGMAALLGIVAAVAIQLAPSPHVEANAQPPVAAEPVAAAAPAPQPAPAIEPQPAPAIDPQPAAEAAANVAPAPAPIVAAVPEPAAVAQPAAQPAPQPAPQPRRARTTPAAKRAPAGEGTLRVLTYNAVWAWVYVGKQRLEVPDAKFRLAAGTHTVRLKNTDLGVTRTCTVRLEAGQVRTLKVEMEEGGCELDR